ncbi:MAG: acyl transferase [Sphingobacteriales bacterium]|nr:MAG: acyl transferase [Sphingobacteriales bacterium]
MFDLTTFKKKLFNITNGQFDQTALELFRYQAVHNEIYTQYLQLLNINYKTIEKVVNIPFLPVEFFKTHQLVCPVGATVQKVFTSSGTTGTSTSSHFIHDIDIYEQSFTRSFRQFFGNPDEYCILALLPSYLERDGSSLIYMVRHLIELSQHPLSGFYLHNYEQLNNTLQQISKWNQKTLLIGVSFALWDFAEQFPQPLNNVTVIETGGMKGRRPEIVREALHRIFCEAWDLTAVCSEYGMTELLSQAYSLGSGRFQCPPWMKVVTHEVNDPFALAGYSETGALSVVDLANVHSCAFLATQDIGRLYKNGTFEVLGRFDYSDVRGCNLLV